MSLYLLCPSLPFPSLPCPALPCPALQYAAFYKWLQLQMKANAVVHFGMHGTVEWLPGSPLGNTGLSWSDALLGNMPNM